MKFYVVIPARYASTRLPAKPLKEMGGKPMIQHVYERACMSDAAEVIIATDDVRIENIGKSFGAPVCMTRTDHNSGTDRLQEVVTQLGLKDDDIVVNVQGDEPLIPPAVINQVANNLQQAKQASVATLCEPIEQVADFVNPNIVKVVADESGIAMYFSRAPIPWPRDHFAQVSGGTTNGNSLAQAPLPQGFIARRHIGIYAYRVALLHEFVTWPQSALEKLESLEQLRVLSYGKKIHVAEAIEQVPGGVDTEADYLRVKKIIEG